MKLVKFIEPHSPYAPGDITGFPDDEADHLIKEGKAVPFKKSVDEAPENKMVNEAPKKK